MSVVESGCLLDREEVQECIGSLHHSRFALLSRPLHLLLLVHILTLCPPHRHTYMERERGLQCRLLLYSNVLRGRRVSTPSTQFWVPNFSKAPLCYNFKPFIFLLIKLKNFLKAPLAPIWIILREERSKNTQFFGQIFPKSA